MRQNNLIIAKIQIKIKEIVAKYYININTYYIKINKSKYIINKTTKLKIHKIDKILILL